MLALWGLIAFPEHYWKGVHRVSRGHFKFFFWLWKDTKDTPRRVFTPPLDFWKRFRSHGKCHTPAPCDLPLSRGSRRLGLPKGFTRHSRNVPKQRPRHFAISAKVCSRLSTRVAIRNFLFYKYHVFRHQYAQFETYRMKALFQKHYKIVIHSKIGIYIYPNSSLCICFFCRTVVAFR